MKIFFIKIFLFVCAVVAIFESILLFMVGLGRISLNDAVSFYNFLLASPNALNLTQRFAAGFLFLGLILLAFTFRGRRPQKSILVKEKGEILRIPIDTVRDFINQLLEKNPYMSDFDTRIDKKGRWVYIDIFSAFNNTAPIRQEVCRLRRILREQIAHVFEFTHFKINFQMKGISIRPEKKDSRSRLPDKEQIEHEKPSTLEMHKNRNNR